MAERNIRAAPSTSCQIQTRLRAESVYILVAIAMLVATVVPGTRPGDTALAMSLTFIRNAFAALPAAAQSGEKRLSPRLSLLAEYKLSCSLISGILVGSGSGSVRTGLCTHQLLSGPALHLRARGG